MHIATKLGQEFFNALLRQRNVAAACAFLSAHARFTDSSHGASVLGKDTTGIVAEIAVTLRECGANIVDISQTLLGDIFSMTMIVTLNTDVADFNTAQERLAAAGERIGVQITLQREDVFQFMYKI